MNISLRAVPWRATGTGRTVRAAAGAYAEPLLPSLDAIHLATAEILAGQAGAEFVAYVAYDRRLLGAARAVGLPVASPGMA